MYFTNIQIDNLFSIDSINHYLHNMGLTLVTGYSHDEGDANGAGKSSFVRNALFWGLYGQTLGGATGNDVVNRHRPKKKSGVQISLVSNDTPYTIHRQRNPNKLSLTSKGSILTFRTEKDTQEAINHILGKDFKSFVQTDFFGQGRAKAFFDLTQSEQRDVIEEILPIEELVEWEEQARIAKRLIEDRIVELTALINQTEGSLGTLEKNLVGLQELINEWIYNQHKYIKEQTKEIAIIDSKYEKIELEIFRTKIEMGHLLKAIEKTDLVSAGIELKKSVSLTTTIQDKIIKIDQKLGINKYKQSENKKQINKLTNLTEKCLECNQVIDLNIKEKQLKLIQKDWSLLDYILEQLEKDKKVLIKNLLLQRQNTAKWENEIGNKDSYTLSLEKHQKYLVYETSILLSLNKDTELKKLDELKTKENPYQKILDTTTVEVQDIKKELDEKITQRQDLQSELERVTFWVGAFHKDLKVLLFEKACPFLTDRTNEYLQLLNNGQISVKFSTTKILKSGDTRDEFNATVSSNTGANIFSLLSGGEQQITNFAVGLALSDLAESQTAGTSELMILDEPFTNLDSRNCENVINFLTSHLSKKKSSILFISNEEGLKGLIPNRIHIEKKNGLSRIV